MAYAPPQFDDATSNLVAQEPPPIGGGRFSNANPKSNLDWAIYRANDGPAPNAYSIPSTCLSASGVGRVCMERPPTQLDQQIRRAKEMPGPGKYGAPKLPGPGGGQTLGAVGQGPTMGANLGVEVALSLVVGVGEAVELAEPASVFAPIGAVTQRKAQLQAHFPAGEIA